MYLPILGCTKIKRFKNENCGKECKKLYLHLLMVRLLIPEGYAP